MAKQKTTDKNLPVRNTIFEALIYAGAIGLFVYAFGILLFTFVANAFNDTSDSSVGGWSLLHVAISGAIVAQAILLIRQSRRVDRYVPRFIATLLTCLLPLMLILRFAGSSLLTQLLRNGESISTVSSNGLYATINFITSGYFMNIAAIASLVGIVWLWVLLLKKDKLLWVLEGNPRTKEYKERKLKLARNNTIGALLVAAPAVLLFIYIITAFSAGSNGNDATLRVLADTMRTVLIYGWIPSVIVGITVLIRNK